LKIISLESTSEDLIINKSKFIGLSFIITTRDSALEKIKCLQSAHPSCSHIAYAYQTYSGNSIEPYFNDAGEPSGTAGKPLLNILENQNIVNTCLAVVRYYGGINLGTGGLARAYSKAGMLALKRSKVSDFTLNNYYLLSFKYSMLDSITHVIYSNNGSIIDKQFTEEIQLKVKITPKGVQEIVARFPLINIEEISQ
jgi:uncharacterized YigZ family protein